MIFNVKTMDQVIAESLADLNLYLWLIGVFAALALLLAMAGIYGVVSYAVTGRTQEFAIRLALGADRRQIWSLVLRRGLTLVVCGLAVGLAGAFTLTRTLRTLVGSATSPMRQPLVWWASRWPSSGWARAQFLRAAPCKLILASH